MTEVADDTSPTLGGMLDAADFSITGINNLTFTDVNGTIAGIENQNLLDKTADALITGVWTFRSLGSETYIRLYNYSDTINSSVHILFRKSHRNTLGYTATVDGEDFGKLSFYGVGSDEDSSDVSVRITAEQDGAGGADYVPGRLVFLTGTNAAAPTEAMRISSDKSITMAGLSGHAGYYVKVNADGKLYIEAS
jgi:hypothetical protein